MGLIGSKVNHAKSGVGVIVSADDRYVDVDFNGVVKTFALSTIHKFVEFEEQKSCDEAKEIAINAEVKEQAHRMSEEQKRIKMPEGVSVIDSKNTVSVRLGGHAKIVFGNSISELDQRRIRLLFDECDNTAMQLYDDFNPKMEYPKITSLSKSRYCVGFVCQYLNTYVIRVFSRVDAYKKRIRTGTTILQSDTTEVMRIISVDGKVHCFAKNITYTGKHINNNNKHKFWQLSTGDLFADEIIRKCDCKYLNDFIEEKDVSIMRYGKLLLCALYDNKAEIVFKHKRFDSVCRIKNLVKYLSDFSSKQIDFACKNDVINTLPFIKRNGTHEVKALKELEKLMVVRYGYSAYEILTDIFKKLHFNVLEIDRRLLEFVNSGIHIDAKVYIGYIRALFYDAITPTVDDFFDKAYEERYKAEWCRSYNGIDEIRYKEAAEELSWIDREDNGYFIRIPKTVDEFRFEGDAQHHCVFYMGYFLEVIEKHSVVVFLRKEKNIPYITIEYNYATFDVLQAYKKFNQPVEPEEYEYIVRLGKQLFKDSYSL